MMANQIIQTIQFHFLVRPVSLAKRTALKLFVSQIFQKERKEFAALTYVFCSDAYLLDINKRFLQHNYFTDIITFNLAERGQPVIGEIYISIDRVRDNATVLSQTFRTELHRVIIHGALHLCGYKDKTRSDIAKMRTQENFYLSSYL